MRAPPAQRETATVRFLLVSIAIHLALVAGLGRLATPGIDDDLATTVPIDLGLVDGKPGGGAEPSPPPAPSPPPPPVPEHVVRPRPLPTQVAVARVVDAGAPTADVVADAGADAAASGGDSSGSGVAASAAGSGFGFGVGTGSGLGLGTGGLPGAMIALQADLARIRESSLVLETEALLELLPGWRELFEGSGLDPLDDLARVLVATPDLRRAHLVVAARVEKGDGAVRRAATRLGRASGTEVAWTTTHGVPTSPWSLGRGPSRVAALLGASEIAIVRAEDVPRLLAIGAALAERNAGLDAMERSADAGALLAMREDEAVAVSVEGARSFVTRNVRAVPESLRISVRSLDEFHAELLAAGTYASAGEAEQALVFVDALRLAWLDHPRVSYLGIRSALDEAALERSGARLTLRMRLTLHQLRYLAAYVGRALRLRD